MTERLHYEVFPARPEAHLFEVRLTIADPSAGGERLALPAWIPGSYMIREFAKNVVSIRATRRNRPIRIEKIDKHSWQTASLDERGGRGNASPLVVTLQVYAHDQSVRSAWLDALRGFFNGTSLFLRVLGREHEPVTVTIRPPSGAAYRRWIVATAMQPSKLDARGFGVYRAASYDELVDHPVEMGELTIGRFSANGVPHRIAISGRHEADVARLSRDLKLICEHHMRFFGPPLPTDRYLFLVNALGEGYGGLEHRASTALVCSRDELPQRGQAAVTEGYRTFLGLVSHEYFHTWNVKRIKPAAFVPYDLDRENYTSLLWAFEGITSYYDDLALMRTGLISKERYLESIAQSITSLARTPGRHVQSVADSSFDAWTKYYRQDENTPNAVVSYYLKGSLIALCLDLIIRARTKAKFSLDDVMRTLWQQHGVTGAGVAEDGIEKTIEAVTGLRLKPFFERAVRGTQELPLAEALAYVGLTLYWRAPRGGTDRGAAIATLNKPSNDAPVSLGMRLAANDVRISHVFAGGAAQDAGLAADDVLVAIDGLRVTPKNFDRHVARMKPGARKRIHAFRRDELIELVLTARRAPLDTCDILLPSRRVPALDAWIGAPR